MPRPPTTGNFISREELVAECIRFARVKNLASVEIAHRCGISVPTVNSILAAASPLTQTETAAGKTPTKRRRSSRRKAPVADGVEGKWCTCYQKVTGAPSPPFAAKVLENKGSRLKVLVNGKELFVHRGACSTTFRNQKKVT